jgi:hypothetical protein
LKPTPKRLNGEEKICAGLIITSMWGVYVDFKEKMMVILAIIYLVFQ